MTDHAHKFVFRTLSASAAVAAMIFGLKGHYFLCALLVFAAAFFDHVKDLND